MKKILSVFLVLIFACSMMILPTDALVVTSSTIDQVVQWAIDTANDDTHGYSQAADRRWGTPDYDCASFVISAYRSVGFKLTYAAHCSNIKEEFMELISSEGKTASVEIGAWIRQHIKDMKNSEIKRGDKI